MKMRELIDIVMENSEPITEIAMMASGENGTLWIDTKTGKIVSTSEGLPDQPFIYKHHSQDVKYHPEKYGLDQDAVKGMPRTLPKSKKTKTARFDHDLMQWMMDSGWVRVNSYGERVEFQGSAKRTVQKAVGLYMDQHPEMTKARVSITPRLEAGVAMQAAELSGHDDIEKFANRGIMRATASPFR